MEGIRWAKQSATASNMALSEVNSWLHTRSAWVACLACDALVGVAILILVRTNGGLLYGNFIRGRSCWMQLQWKQWRWYSQMVHRLYGNDDENNNKDNYRKITGLQLLRVVRTTTKTAMIVKKEKANKRYCWK